VFGVCAASICARGVGQLCLCAGVGLSQLYTTVILCYGCWGVGTGSGHSAFCVGAFWVCWVCKPGCELLSRRVKQHMLAHRGCFDDITGTNIRHAWVVVCQSVGYPIRQKVKWPSPWIDGRSGRFVLTCLSSPLCGCGWLITGGWLLMRRCRPPVWLKGGSGCWCLWRVCRVFVARCLMSGLRYCYGLALV
jgi:hypothetical protein